MSEFKANDLLSVSVVTGGVAKHDAISNITLAQVAAFARFAKERGVRLRIKLYALWSEAQDSRIFLATGPQDLALDEHFLNSDLVLFNFGFKYPLFDAIHVAPMSARKIVCFYGITAPIHTPAEERSAVEDSYRQAAAMLIADKVVTTSKFLVDELVHMGVRRDRIVQIPLPSPLPAVQAPPPRPSPLVDLRLLYVGRFVQAKGVHDLIEAAGRLRARGVHVRLKLVGSRTFSRYEYLDRLHDAVARLGMVDEVEFLHDVSSEDLTDCYRWAQALVLPSRHEGFCVPVIEALAHGCRIVASDAGSLLEIIGGLGLTFPAANVDALTARIEQFIHAPRDAVVVDSGTLELSQWQEKVREHLSKYSLEHFETSLCNATLKGIEPIAEVNRKPLADARRLALGELLSNPVSPLESPTISDRLEAALHLGSAGGSLRVASQGSTRQPRAETKLAKALRYIKRVVMLPWRFQEMYDQFAAARDEIRAIRDCQMEGLSGRNDAIRGLWQVADGTAHIQRAIRDHERRSGGEAVRRRQEFDQFTAEQRNTLTYLQHRSDELRVILSEVRNTEVGQNNWIELLQRKLEMLALDVRERVPIMASGDELPEPRFVNPKQTAAKLSESNGARVNVGCGEQTMEGYLNVDRRPLPGVDVIADARRLPFEKGSLAEIASSHLVEHFRRHHLTSVVIPYWKSLLRLDGSLRIVCPNWEAMIERVGDKRMSLEDFTLVAFGLQDYEGDDHFAMYTPDSMTDILHQAGFQSVEVVARERQNGVCPEMEILARGLRNEHL